MAKRQPLSVSLEITSDFLSEKNSCTEPKENTETKVLSDTALAVTETSSEVFELAEEINSVSETLGDEFKKITGIKALERNVGRTLDFIDDAIMHSYVTVLEKLPVIEPHFDAEKIRKEPYQFFHITKMVYEQDEFSVAKLSAIFQTVAEKNSTLVLMIQNKNNTADFYLGVRNHEEKDFTGTLRQMLEMSLQGQFPGSNFDSDFSVEKMSQITRDLKDSTKSVSCVSCVPDFKQDKDFFENKDFLQGLEKLVTSMQSRDYTAVFVADAVHYDELSSYRQQLESISTQLSSFSSMQYQISTTDTDGTTSTLQSSVTNTNTEGTSDTEGTNASISIGNTEGVTDTTGTSHTHGANSSVADSTSHGKTITDGTSQSTSVGITKTNTFTLGSSQTIGLNAGVNAGINIAKIVGVGVGTMFGGFGSLGFNQSFSHSVAKSNTETTGTSHSVGISDTVSKTLTEGISDSDTSSQSRALNKSTSQSNTIGTSQQHGTNSSYSEAFNLGTSEALSKTIGTTKGITIQNKNMMIDNMLERIRHQTERIEESESFGMWNCAAYFMSESRAVSETAANTYRSLISGKNSGVERSAVNTWSDKNIVNILNTYITHFCHPKFIYQSADGENHLVSPASLISTKELAIQLSLPRKSVCGLPVVENAVFGQEIILNRKSEISDKNKSNRRNIEIGSIYHLSKTSKSPVKLDLDSLAMHTFITGSTGSGKSNTTYNILDSLSSYKIPFLVIEPAKGEYRYKFKNAKIFGTNPKTDKLLKLNPFSFPKEMHVQEHIDRLVEIFNVCWPMYAAMPAVLKDSIICAYEAAGWDVMQSENSVHENLYPTFEDVLNELENVVNNSTYSADTSSDYKGALKTRIKSLTNGINGMIFSNNEISYHDLFDSETIVDLSRVGSMETKSLLMGILVLKLQEYRMSTKNGTDNALSHVTVLEEAHNLLKRTSTEQGQETANLQGKSVEMLTNAIAEMRTYGEGFIIADQAPNLLDEAVIRNTNTKIVLRLPEENDREAVGHSMGLNDNQINELSKLPTGIGAVYQNDWHQAVLCDINRYTQLNLPAKNDSKKENLTEVQILASLLSDTESTESITTKILCSNAPAKIRKDIIMSHSMKNLYYEWAVADYITNRFNCKSAFAGSNRSFDSIEELGELVTFNVSKIFPEFSNDIIDKICELICRKAFEENPDCKAIEMLRSQYFKERCMNNAY